MTVPGVNLICAAWFIAAVGDPQALPDASRSWSPISAWTLEVKQSGEDPARSGRISKRGSPSARWALVEAAWTAVLQPGPLHAFYERTKNRRGHGKAIVATARKLAILFWCMLTRSEDYAHQQPSLTRKKLRRLEITAGAPQEHPQSRRHLVNQRPDAPGRARTRPASRGVIQANGPRPAGRCAGAERSARARHRSAHRFKSLKRGQSRAADQAPDVCSSLRRSPAPTHQPTPRTAAPGKRTSPAAPQIPTNTDLTFIGRSKGLSAQLISAPAGLQHFRASSGLIEPGPRCCDEPEDASASPAMRVLHRWGGDGCRR